MGSKLLIGNDHLLYLTGTRDAQDYSFVLTATVSATVLDAKGGSAITGGGPISLSLVSIGTDDIGGTPASPTTIKSTDGFDVVVTVGATNALDLSAGRLLRALHDPNVWKLRLDAAGAVDADVTLHLEPFIWGGRTRPRKLKLVEGEVIEIEDGTYVGILDKAFDAEDGKTYNVKYTAEDSGRDGQWDEEVDAEYREGLRI
jgi:hypothetical protein